MARSKTDLPRMQNPARSRARARPWSERCRASGSCGKKKHRSPPRMMRQYDLIERVRRYNPNTDEALLNRAYVYAMKAHGEQKRASGDPYFSHPLEVAAILTDLKLDDATIAAALLHDTIEDTPTTRAEIDQIFGPDIGHLVEGLTKLKKLDLVSREAKQAENLRKLLLAIADDVRVLLVKLADRLHNMRTLQLHAAGGAPAHRRGDAGHLCAARRPHGHAGDARGAGGSGVPRALSGGPPGGRRAARQPRPNAAATLIGEIEQQLTRKLAELRHHRGGSGPAQAALFDLAQDGAQVGRLRAALRHLRLPRDRADAGRVLPRARRRAHDLADGAGPLQGLRLDAQAERLPLDPHHRDRPRQPARRAADPHRGDARDRRIRHRRACALQGQRRLSRPRRCRARSSAYRLAAPHHRAAGGRLQSGGISRAHQARTVPRPGVLLHARRAS